MKKKYIKPEIEIISIQEESHIMAVSQGDWADSKGGNLDLDEDFDDFSDSSPALNANEDIWHE